MIPDILHFIHRRACLFYTLSRNSPNTGQQLVMYIAPISAELLAIPTKSDKDELKGYA